MGFKSKDQTLIIEEQAKRTQERISQGQQNLALIEETREEIKNIQNKTKEIINQRNALEQELAQQKAQAKQKIDEVKNNFASANHDPQECAEECCINKDYLELKKENVRLKSQLNLSQNQEEI